METTQHTRLEHWEVVRTRNRPPGSGQRLRLKLGNECSAPRERWGANRWEGICSNSGSLTLGENRGERQMSQRYIHTTGQRDATGPRLDGWSAVAWPRHNTQCSLSVKGQLIFEGLFFLLLTLISSGMVIRGRGKISHGFIVRKKGDCFAARVTI